MAIRGASNLVNAKLEIDAILDLEVVRDVSESQVWASDEGDAIKGRQV